MNKLIMLALLAGGLYMLTKKKSKSADQKVHPDSVGRFATQQGR